MENLAQTIGTVVNKRPAVEDYDDVYIYLREVLAWKQSQRRYSYAQLAKDCGLASRSFARLLLIGQRTLTDSNIHKIAEGLGLKHQEKDYFFYLAKYSQAEKIEEKEFYSKKIFKQGQIKAKSIDSTYQFLTNKYVPRVLSLLSVPGLRCNESGLGQILGCSEAQVREALLILHQLGLAKVVETSSAAEEWTATLKDFVVNDSKSNLAVQTYHKKTLEDLIASLHLSTEERDLRSALIPMTEESYRALRDELSALLPKLLQKYQSSSAAESQQLYSVHFGSTPVSQKFGGQNEIL